MARVNFNKFKQAVQKVKTAKEKTEETKLHITRMSEMQQYVEEFKANPLNWSNNKRRRRGLKPLRKDNSFSKRKWNKVRNDLKFFKLIEETIDETIGNYFSSGECFNNLVDIKNIPF